MTPAKRLCDLLIAGGLGLILLPLIVMLALVIRLTEGGPVFYVAERMKTPTQGFGLIKFRTMPQGSGDGGVTGGNKMVQLSPLQRAMRRSRADELPQLWNVIRGDISLVGPRPPLRRYVQAYPDLYAQVLASRPGITGLASLVYANHEERLLAACRDAAETEAVYRRRCIPVKARLDLIYQARRSVCYDLVLIARTARRPFVG